MQRLPRSLVWTILAAGGVACADAARQDATLPSDPAVLAAPPAPVGCSFRSAQDLARAYFALNTDRRTAADLLRAAEAAPEGSRLRNDAFFSLFQLIESARAAGTAGSAAAGAGLILEADDCGEFVISHRDGQLSDVLTEALSTGAFSYRDAGNAFVATQDLGVALQAPWATWIGGRAMVFGALFTPATGFAEHRLSGSYRLGLIFDGPTDQPGTPGPNSSNDDIATVELCPLELATQPEYRVGRIKSSGGQTVLQQSDIAGFCDVSASLGGGGWLARATRQVTAWVLPAPLQARMMAPPGMAGGVGELSDFAVVDAQYVVVAYLTQPQDGLTSTDIPFTVRATGANGTPLENVLFSVAVAGNEGTTVVLSGGCLPTNEQGVAACTVQLNKTGGYRLQVTSGFPGFDPVTLVSGLFNLQQR